MLITIYHENGDDIRYAGDKNHVDQKKNDLIVRFRALPVKEKENINDNKIKIIKDFYLKFKTLI